MATGDPPRSAEGEGGGGNLTGLAALGVQIYQAASVGGKGRMAARGAAAMLAKIQRAQLGQAILGTKLAFAQQQLVNFRTGEHPILKQQPFITPQVRKLGQQIAKLEAKKAEAKNAQRLRAIQAHQVRKQQKLARVEAKLAPQAEYYYFAEYGLNNPPVPGARF